MIKKTIGILILIVVFAGLFYATVETSSLKEAALIWGGAALLAGVIVTAVFLVVGD
ncbi:MAG TPA: hypothetical protein VKN74_02840 [Candidatus Mcinerneyibacterium sp.]|nr:hypothetical protein [Candidatus Mcinerneyibacterium sp.]